MNGEKPPPVFGPRVAKASRINPIVILDPFMFGHQIAPHMILELTPLLLIVAGICLSIADLIGIPWHGQKGILDPALVGLVPNGLLVFVFYRQFSSGKARHWVIADCLV